MPQNSPVARPIAKRYNHPMPRVSRVAWGCFIGLLWMTQAAPAADVPANQDRQAVLSRQRDHYLQTVESLLPLSQHRMDQILQLRVQSGQLTLHTPLNPSPDFEARRADVQGLSSPAAVTYVQFVPNNPTARQFEFKLEEYPDKQTYAQLHLQWQPGVMGRVDDLSIERTEQTAHGFLRVFYHQGVTMARVLVFANDASTDHNLESFNCTEKDFSTLCKMHPLEVEQYMRPILHEIGQDVVFAPDVNTAWQVLAAQWPMDGSIDHAVRHELPALDDPNSHIRNQATHRLVNLGRDGASAIMRLDRHGLSLEQNVRLDDVISHFRQISPITARRLENNPDFLLDCGYSGDATVRRLAIARLAHVLGHPIQLDPDAPEGARVEAVDQLRRQLRPEPATRPTD